MAQDPFANIVDDFYPYRHRFTVHDQVPFHEVPSAGPDHQRGGRLGELVVRMRIAVVDGQGRLQDLRARFQLAGVSQGGLWPPMSGAARPPRKPSITRNT